MTAKPLKGKLTAKIQQLLLGQDWSVSYDIPGSRSIVQATKIRHYNVESKNKTVRYLAWWVATNTDIHKKTLEGPPFGPSKLDTRRLQINTHHKGLRFFKSLIVKNSIFIREYSLDISTPQLSILYQDLPTISILAAHHRPYRSFPESALWRMM